MGVCVQNIHLHLFGQDKITYNMIAELGEMRDDLVAQVFVYELLAVTDTFLIDRVWLEFVANRLVVFLKLAKFLFNAIV